MNLEHIMLNGKKSDTGHIFYDSIYMKDIKYYMKDRNISFQGVVGREMGSDAS